MVDQGEGEGGALLRLGVAHCHPSPHFLLRHFPGPRVAGRAVAEVQIRLYLEHLVLHVLLYRDPSPELGVPTVLAAKHHLHHPQLGPSYHRHPGSGAD